MTNAIRVRRPVMTVTRPKVVLQLGGTSGGGGSAWFTGTGAPDSSLGANTDCYLDDASGDVYQKVSGTWTLQTNIKGPNGIVGADGIGISAGDGAPVDDAAPGSLYIDSTTGDLYRSV